MSVDTSRPSARPWRTTREVAESVGVHATTILRWAREGVLPAPDLHHGGRRGQTSRFSVVAVAQAAWVKSHLENGFSFEEIRSKLAAGEFQSPLR
ncbi:MerR family transcriptional regulator [Nannocystis pusilla]|uniref:MerR family transcriptional regulator n=1 Tax=Nannocystis pusilla TaxID=889268 RepID=A0ABS7U477_9BACT|nr:MerR family transcriptional regulator [Nannocystis pusilla]